MFERRWSRGGVALLDVRHPKHGTPQKRCVVNCIDFEFNAPEVQILREMEMTAVEFVQKSPDGKF